MQLMKLAIAILIWDNFWDMEDRGTRQGMRWCDLSFDAEEFQSWGAE